MSIILESLTALRGTKQKKDEPVQDLTTGFKTSRDILKTYLGGYIMLTKAVQLMSDCDKHATERMSRFQWKDIEYFLYHLCLQNPAVGRSGRQKWTKLLQGVLEPVTVSPCYS
jgi:hypothetical protein